MCIDVLMLFLCVICLAPASCHRTLCQLTYCHFVTFIRTVCYVISGAFSLRRRRFYSAVDAAVNLAGSSIFMLSISESIKKNFEVA